MIWARTRRTGGLCPPRRTLSVSGPSRENVVPILYRPFDIRYTYYTGHSGGFICRPRAEVMRHMLQENVALCVGRAGQVVGREQWNLAFCATGIDDLNLFYRGGNLNLPLYVYPNGDRDLFSRLETAMRTPNLNLQIMAALARAYGKEPTPEDIFHYVYGVLYTPAYREKYAEFLRMDFPRVPFAINAEVFGADGRTGTATGGPASAAFRGTRSSRRQV